MCLAVPMRVKEIFDDNSCVVETDGLSFKADISLLENVSPGDYVLIHAGFAIEKLNTAEASARIELFNELALVAGKPISQLL
jgi:hydrogenase expression/formation protein HypC